MDLKRIEKVVASIQGHLFRNSNSFAVGMLKSHFKGAGLQFKEHQIYAPGDDVRFIDWKLSAKSQNTYVKTFEEERNIEIIPFLDCSMSMHLGYKGVSKLQASIEIICLLYLLAEKSKDKIKTIIYLDRAMTLPPLSGHEGIVFFVSMLERTGIFLDGKINYKLADFKPDQSKKLSLLKSLVARKKEVVFLSDFNHFEEDFKLLNKLIYRRNMHCFKVISPIDEMKKKPFSLFAKLGEKKSMIQINSSLLEEPIGRWKKLDVSKRYLEDFIREML